MYLILPSEVRHVHIIKVCSTVDATPSLILNLELARLSGQPQAPSHFTTEERAHSTIAEEPCGSQTYTGSCGEEKNLSPDQQKPDLTIVCPVAYSLQ
jgi:hypothetical protein